MSFSPGSNGVHWLAASAHTLPKSPPRFLQVWPSSALHCELAVQGEQLHGLQRPIEQVWPRPQSPLTLHGRHLGCESPPRPPCALTRAVG
jgi:hypothetical protein